MPKQLSANSDKSSSVQVDTAGNAQRKDDSQLIEMAAEQFASLLWMHSMLNKNSRGRQSRKGPNPVANKPHGSIIDLRNHVTRLSRYKIQLAHPYKQAIKIPRQNRRPCHGYDRSFSSARGR